MDLVRPLALIDRALDTNQYSCKIKSLMHNDRIDNEGYRENVGIIIANDAGKLLLAGRIGSKGWQFPQGGMLDGESAEQAMFRELNEEVGLSAADVEILGYTRG
jgi:putative (di)nucleoside polyphosphate hydrolase